MKKSAIILVLSFYITFVSAQNTVTFDVVDTNNTTLNTLVVPLRDTNNVEIDLQGNIAATTTWDDMGLDSGFQTALIDAGIAVGSTISAPTLSFSCTNSTSGNNCTNINSNSTLVTVTVSPGASYCNEYTGSDTIPFNTVTNSTDPYIQTISYTIDDTTQSSYSIECGNYGGSSTRQTINPSLATIPVVTITPISQLVTSGSNIDVVWSFTANSDDCLFTGDWPVGTITDSYISTGFPSLNFTIPNITSNKTIAVNCRNTVGTSPEVERTYSIGSTTTAWTQCINGSTANPVANGNEDRTIFGNNTANAGLYNGFYSDFQNTGSAIPWPGQLGESISLSLTKNRYIAAKFNTGSAQFRQTIQYIAPGNIQGTASNITSTTISTCPGEFNSPVGGQDKCARSSGNLRWSTDPAANPAFYCMLDSNTEYFLNIIHSDNSENDNYSTSGCPSATHCGVLVQQTNSTL